MTLPKLSSSLKKYRLFYDWNYFTFPSFQPFVQFWPSGQDELENENFKVKFTDESEHAVGTCNEFTVQSMHDDYELRVRMIRCANWPHSCASMTAVFDLLNLVQEWHMDNHNGPVVVVDR